ncbi:hypothetical protein [Pseudomonas extremaustralis]|uniref:hypothetical protein n=1 Tax=Pseudomonas extremaustralis TaxID=359110 RepID=UPI002AA7748C|nr:hypothetical protein [Pseudomonas extremaustralis]
MTTNKTIDGVPRHWAEIEAAVRGAFQDGKKDYNGCMRERLRELRALLDAPAVECKAVKRYDRDSVAGHCDVEISLPEHMILHHDHGPNLAEALARLAGRVARFHKLEAPSLAAQPQGAPVVLMELVENKIYGGMHIAKWDNSGGLKEGLHRLYAEQPAPVAVASRDESIAWLKRIDGIGQARAELIYSMGFRRHTDVPQS